MSSTTPTAPIVKRACDACNKRKVRCSGTQPCYGCTSARLQCTYNKIPQKKGPKGSRAKVITGIRNSQAEAQAANSPDRSTPWSPTSSGFAREPADILPSEFIDACAREYLDTMFTTIPIMTRPWLSKHILEAQRPGYHESFCVIGALCVFMLSRSWTLLGAYPNPMSPTVRKQYVILVCQQIISEIHRVRNYTDFRENPTTSTILTSFLLSGALFDIESPNSSWYYLQEAITFAKMLRIHIEDEYGSDLTVDHMHRRIFWILFITERAQALHKHRETSLQETVNFPRHEIGNSLDRKAINGLTCLYNLFRMVDETFARHWRNLRATTAIMFPNDFQMWLADLQAQLSSAIPAGIELNNIQMSDLHITQLWLRTQVWLLSNASRSLSSSAADETMTFTYPIQIANQLLLALDPNRNGGYACIEIHGVGVVEKIFDIAYSSADVIALNPNDSEIRLDIGARDYATAFLTHLSMLRNGETKYVGLLQAKMQDMSLGINESIPPRPSAHSSAASSQALSMGQGRVNDETDQRPSPYPASSNLMSSSGIVGRALPYSIDGHFDVDMTATDPNLSGASNSRTAGVTNGPNHYAVTGHGFNAGTSTTDPNLASISTGTDAGPPNGLVHSPNHPYPTGHYGPGTGY